MRYSVTLRGGERKFYLLAGAAFAALALTSTPASAQEAGAESEEIIVTAQRRAEALEDVPISIANVSGEALESAGLSDVMALPQAVPALRITRAGTFVQPTIRGIGSQVAMPGLPQNITVYVDGYYVPTAAATNFSLVNLESVNVLKGPQGTLFGFNTTGGAIQLTTRTPSHDPSAMLRVSAGDFGRFGAAFYGTTGLTEELAADFAFGYDRGDGVVTNVVTNDDAVGEFNNYYVRSNFLLEPTNGISFRLGLAHSLELDPTTQMIVARDGISIAAPIPGAVIATQRGQVSLDNPGYAKFSSSSLTLTSEFDLGFATLTSYSGYREDTVKQGLDYEGSSEAINFSHWTVPDSTFTQEVTLASNPTPDDRFSWVLGAFYMHHEDNYDYNTNGNPIFTSNNTTISTAVFADATYQFAPDWYLTLGGRYSWDNPQVSSFLIPFSLTTSAEENFSDFTGRVVLRHELSPNSNIYASFTQGYKAGALPASTFSTIPVLPESIDAYEIGYKTVTSNVRFDIAAFYYDYQDVQVTTYGAGGAGTVVNAAAVESYGIDGSLIWDISPDLSLTVGGGWTHARYADFPNATGFNFDPVAGTITNTLVDATGADVQRTPDFSGNVALDYGFDLGGGRMALNANVFYTGDFVFDVAQQLPQDGYTLLNLRATWTDPSQHFDLSVFGTNVTDETYFVSSFIDPYAARSVYGNPAQWGVSLTYHMN